MAKQQKQPPKSDSKTTAKKNLDIRINAFGQIERGYDLDSVNQFLTENVKDRKLDERDGELPPAE